MLVRPSPAPFRPTRAILPTLLALLLAGCAVGPDFARPESLASAAGAQFRERPDTASADSGWKPASPASPAISDRWWEIYGDATLNGLMDQIEVNNQTLRQYEAQYRQAQATAAAARAAFFPTLTGNASYSRSRSATTSSSTGTTTGPSRISTSRALSLDASWEADLWGQVRRSVEAGDASTLAGAAQLASARLSAQATLAQNYFQLRVIDAEQALYAQTLAAYERSLAITRNQFAVGINTRADVAQAESQYQSALAQNLDLSLQRRQLEHAIAQLLGKAPADFALPAATTASASNDWRPEVPVVPVGVPSTLLERRPDVAAAEYQAAAANARIGVAKAAFFPALTLTGSTGYRGQSLAQWFDAPSRAWSLGASLAQSIFDGGLRRAQTDQAIAAYDVTVAQYRQTVLGALVEVEDNLAALRILDEEGQVQDKALAAAREAERLALNQYKAGTANYLSVVVAQANSLNAARSAYQILGRRLSASVLLVKALGGHWEGNGGSAAAPAPSGTPVAQAPAAPQ